MHTSQKTFHMLYHYTTLPAMKSILKDANASAQMCFWATRYDCFADAEEFKLGVETIRRLLPFVEKDMPTDRQISSLFRWDEIKDNKNLPYPYVVSFSLRPDNGYMWREYAKENGLVLEIDDSVCVSVPDSPMVRLAPCIYSDVALEDKLIEMLRQEYTEIGYRILGGPQKEIAFTLLKNNPQSFVKLIAYGLLFVSAPRIKGAKDYRMEEETRAIIPVPCPEYNELIEGYDEIITKFGFNPSEMKTLVANEFSRQREDGTTMYYRKMHLPISLLKGIYVKSEATRKEIVGFLSMMGMDIPVKSM